MLIYFWSLISSQYLCVNRFVWGDEEGVLTAKSIFRSFAKHFSALTEITRPLFCGTLRGCALPSGVEPHPSSSCTQATQQDCFMFLINNKLQQICKAATTVKSNYRLDFTARGGE